MTRSTWILALALLAIPLAPAHAAKPQPAPAPPQLVAFVYAYVPSGNYGFVGADTYGRLFTTNGDGSGFSVAAQLPGVPVSFHIENYGTSVLYVGLANGDIYRKDTRSALPWALEYMGNVLGSGAPARLPAFPDLGALEDARPILTGDGAPAEPDGPGVVK